MENGNYCHLEPFFGAPSPALIHIRSDVVVVVDVVGECSRLNFQKWDGSARQSKKSPTSQDFHNLPSTKYVFFGEQDSSMARL